MRALGKWSIENNVTVNLIMIFIIMAGIFTVMKMRREMFPQFSLDMVVVSVVYPGSSPEEVEEGICIKIEEQIQSIVALRPFDPPRGREVAMLLQNSKPERILRKFWMISRRK